MDSSIAMSNTVQKHPYAAFSRQFIDGKQVERPRASNCKRARSSAVARSWHAPGHLEIEWPEPEHRTTLKTRINEPTHVSTPMPRHLLGILAAKIYLTIVPSSLQQQRIERYAQPLSSSTTTPHEHRAPYHTLFATPWPA